MDTIYAGRVTYQPFTNLSTRELSEVCAWRNYHRKCFAITDPWTIDSIMLVAATMAKYPKHFCSYRILRDREPIGVITYVCVGIGSRAMMSGYKRPDVTGVGRLLMDAIRYYGFDIRGHDAIYITYVPDTCLAAKHIIETTEGVHKDESVLPSSLPVVRYRMVRPRTPYLPKLFDQVCTEPREVSGVCSG